MPIPQKLIYGRLEMAKQALGKGLGALIKSSNTAGNTPATSNNEPIASGDAVRQTAITDIVPSPLQPRSEFSETQLTELMESIRQHGIIQPLIVREVNGKMELIAGERRWRASTQLGLTKVPVIVRSATDLEVLEMALIENLQREDLNPIEEALGYVRLAKEFEMKQGDIAKRVGKSRASVANAMRLLFLHEDIQTLVSKGTVSVGHAKAVLALKEHDAQKLAVDHILKKRLTVRAAERFVQTFQKTPNTEKTSRGGNSVESADLSAALSGVQEKLRELLATNVNIHHSAKKGRIEIDYYGNDDLDRILDLLGLPSDTL